MDETKTCTKCGAVLPATTMFFCANKRGRLGLHPWCKDCFKASVKARYDADPPKAREQAYAARHARATQLKEYNRDYCALNRERKLQITREARQRNREKYRKRELTRPKSWLQENRRYLQEWYSQGCVICHLVFLPGGMQAHHRDPSEKDRASSQLLYHNKETLVAELAKCDPLCATHHLMLTQIMREDRTLSYDQVLTMLREHWRETLARLRDSFSGV